MVVTEMQLPADVVGFSLRICPRCSSEFKVRATHRDGLVLVSAFAEHVPTMNRAELDAGAVLRHCPYCGTTHPAQAWWTAAQRTWIEQQARSLGQEIRWRWMQLPFDLLGQNPRPTYVSVPPSAAPTSEPEEAGDELIAVPLPCCGEEIQVTDGWIAPVRCHYCGLVHARRIARDFGLELAQLRARAARRAP